MRPVEVPGDEVVEAIVVNPRQPVGAFDVLPHPGLERRLDFHELVLGGLGVGGVEDPFLNPVLLELVVDLRQRGVEGVHQEFAGMATGCAPVGRGTRDASEGIDVDRPARDLDRVIDGRFDAKDLVREGGNNVGWNPRRAEARRDIGRLQVLGQGLFERRDIALITRIERRGGLGGRELVADLAREIGVGRRPEVAVHRGCRLGGRGRCARPAPRSPSRATDREARRCGRDRRGPFRAGLQRARPRPSRSAAWFPDAARARERSVHASRFRFRDRNPRSRRRARRQGRRGTAGGLAAGRSRASRPQPSRSR